MSVRQQLATVSLAVLLGLWTTTAAHATTMVRLSLEQLSQASSSIVRGRVLDQESGWNAAHTQIVTLTTIAVDQVWKGHPPAQIMIEQLGGKAGHIREYVAGSVHFLPQATYVLFLEPATTDSTRYLVVGMTQGAYRIYQDATTHEERVIQPLGGVFYGSRSGLAPAAGAAPLTQFRQQLSGALEAPIVIPKGTSLSVRIETTESPVAGRISVLGRTAFDAYPSRTVVVPAGSEVDGIAERVAGRWQIHWTGISIRDTRVPIAATSQEPAEQLGGRVIVIRVR